MVDVLLILLVFFMVTSTYLDLDMVPATSSSEAAGRQPVSTAPVILIRLSADGGYRFQGKRLDVHDLGALIAERVARQPDLRVQVLPAPQASLQSMITMMNVASGAGASSVGFLRLEASEK